MRSEDTDETILSGGRMNNYEKIKNMTLDEMAEWLRKFSNCSFCNLYLKPKTCSNCKQNYERPFKQWLQQESEG